MGFSLGGLLKGGVSGFLTGGVGGAIAGGLGGAFSGGSKKGRQAAGQAAGMADPFAPYRSEYAGLLRGLYMPDTYDARGRAFKFAEGSKTPGAGANVLGGNAPFLTFGDTAMERLQQLPGYQFRLGEGQRALERSASARGGLLTGGLLVDLMRQGQDYASTEYDKEVQRLMQLSGATGGSPGVAGQLAYQGAQADFATDTKTTKGVGWLTQNIGNIFGGGGGDTVGGIDFSPAGMSMSQDAMLAEQWD